MFEVYVHLESLLTTIAVLANHWTDSNIYERNLIVQNLHTYLHPICAIYPLKKVASEVLTHCFQADEKDKVMDKVKRLTIHAYKKINCGIV